MKTLFDSSVLVAFCVKNHPKHSVASQWLEKAKQKEIEGYVAAHSLIETYSVLTRSPFKPKIEGDGARKMLQTNILPIVKLITLDADDYKKVIQKLADYKFIGGISYDAIILESVQQVQIKQIITANAKDFIRLKNAFEYDVDVVGI